MPKREVAPTLRAAIEERINYGRYLDALGRERRWQHKLQEQLRPKGKALRKARRHYAEHVLKTAGSFDDFLKAKSVLTYRCAEGAQLQKLIDNAAGSACDPLSERGDRPGLR